MKDQQDDNESMIKKRSDISKTDKCKIKGCRNKPSFKDSDKGIYCKTHKPDEMI